MNALGRWMNHPGAAISLGMNFLLGIWGHFPPESPMPDYIPTKRERRKAWLENLSNKAAEQVVAGGGSPETATGLKAEADALIAAYEDTDSAKTTYEGKIAVEVGMEGTRLSNIRALLTTLKVLPNWKPSGADAQLQASSSRSAFDPDTYKPVLTIRLKGGHITLNFKKRGVDGLAIYTRLGGTTAWTKLDVRTLSPYIDGRPLAVPGVPEIREYMARGILKDQEIGLESDITSLVFGG